MHDTNISLADAQQTASIIDRAIRQSFERNKHHLNTDMALVYEKDVLQELIDSGYFRQHDLKNLQQIVQVCFKNYYFREKKFVLKVYSVEIVICVKECFVELKFFSVVSPTGQWLDQQSWKYPRFLSKEWSEKIGTGTSCCCFAGSLPRLLCAQEIQGYASIRSERYKDSVSVQGPFD